MCRRFDSVPDHHFLKVHCTFPRLCALIIVGGVGFYVREGSSLLEDRVANWAGIPLENRIAKSTPGGKWLWISQLN